ncbi:MAG: SusC/RagA family TonB-linked outer membrane protein, partial [Bacteroidetes bacterium]|nr:SusC/RagA family TonB-linked outer membrane protein [Bacteroidota bacterium]
FGKLRGSYGIVGNDQIINYGFQDTYSASFAPYGSVAAFIPTRIANPLFSWETSKKLEAGLELGFCNNNLMVNASWYRNRSGNLLVSAPLTSQTGFTSYTANLDALVQNQGLELEIKGTPIKKKGFTWNTAFNITISRNKLLSYPDIKSSTYTNSYVVGQSLHIIPVYHFTGFANGSATVQDADKDGKLTQGLLANGNGDYIVAGTTDPKYYGGWSNTLQYKNWQLDFFFNYVKQLGTRILPFPGMAANSYADVLNAGFAPSTQTTSAAYSSYNNYYLNSDARITDASYIRLRNITLSWNLPQAWRNAIKMSSCRFYVSGQNLLTITSYKGFDPETQAFTPMGQYFSIAPAFPPLKIVTAGIQCSF